MTTRHVARAVAVTTTAAPQWRTDIRVGGHELVADEPAAAGGEDTGPSPFGLLMSALAACTAMTLRIYAERKGWVLSLLEVDVRYDVDEAGVSSIARTITVPAELPADQRDRLADVAERTPVTLALKHGNPIATTTKT